MVTKEILITYATICVIVIKQRSVQKPKPPVKRVTMPFINRRDYSSQTGKPVDDPAKLLGALTSLHELPRDNPKWAEWKIKGQALLNQKKED